MEENRKNPRGRGSKYEDRKAQAELMWADRFEMTIPEIAKKYKVSVRTVRNRLDEFPKENYDRSLVKIRADEKEVSPAQLTESAQMWEDRNNGMTLDQLSKKYGMAKETIRNKLNGYFPDRPTVALEKQRIRENDKLDFLEEEAIKLLGQDYIVVNHGKTIIDPRTGEPMLDHEPKFKAIKALLDIHARRGKLNGSDAPQRAEVKHTVGEKDEEDLMDLFEAARAKQEATEARIRKALDGGGEIIDAEVVEESDE